MKVGSGAKEPPRVEWHNKASKSRELLASSGLIGCREGTHLQEPRESKIQL